MGNLGELIERFALNDNGDYRPLHKKAIEYSLFVLYLYENRHNDSFDYKGYLYEMIKRDFETDLPINDIMNKLEKWHFDKIINKLRIEFSSLDYDVWLRYVDELIRYSQRGIRTDWKKIEELLYAYFEPQPIDKAALAIVVKHVLQESVVEGHVRILNLSNMKSKSLADLKAALTLNSHLKPFVKTLEQQRNEYFSQKLSYLFLEEYEIDVSLGDIQSALQFEMREQDVIFYSTKDANDQALKDPIIIIEELKEMLNALKVGGTLICFAPSNLLYKSHYIEVRQWLVENYCLQAVIEMKPEKKVTRSKYDLNILILKHSSHQNGQPVLMVKDYENVQMLQNILAENLIHFTKECSERMGIIYYSELILQNLSPSYYVNEKFIDPLLGELIIYPEKMDKTVPLSELADLINGVNLPSDQIEYTAEGMYRLLRVSDFDDSLDEHKLETVNIKSMLYTHAILQQGDILISARGKSIKILKVTELLEMQPIVVTQNTYIIRPHTLLMSDYLNIYLNCPIAQMQLKKMQKGANVKLIALKDLAMLQVKVVEPEQLITVNALHEQYRDSYYKQLDELMKTYQHNMLNVYEKMGITEYMELIKR